jgi:outer membrane protein assembly factor BamB
MGKTKPASTTKQGRIRNLGWKIFLGILLLAVIAGIILFVPFGRYDFSPAAATAMTADGSFAYNIPLDPASPWAKFRANELQNGRTPVIPMVDESLAPWSYRTGKGIFSSPVIDANGNCYIGSADTYFYNFNPDGTVKWKLKTGDIIDSSALLDDQGRVYFGSGDAHVYALDRETGEILWKEAAHSVEEVEELYDMVLYNLNWFEGNIAMLPDGSLIAPNDNYLVYTLARGTGEKGTVFVANEMVWSLPSVNVDTGKVFFGTANQVLNNVYAYDFEGNRQWLTGSFGTVAASTLLTNPSAKGAVVVGGFDGFVRAFAQDSGKQLWKFGTKDHIYASPAQLSDGTIIQASTDGTLYALNPETGKSIWEFDTLEPIRSSPAVDGHDNIYFGNGEGKLYCVNPDGTLRWSYQAITADRNDLNGSPALGFNGVYIAGESGEVFFVPYDYPLTEAGQKDERCHTGGEAMPPDGANLIFTTSFGALKLDPPEAIDANEPLTFSLVVRQNGDNLLSAFDRDSVQVEVAGNQNYRVEVGATDRFVNIVPVEAWLPNADGKLTLTVTADYKTRLSRFGLKFFGGRRTGRFSQTFTFALNDKPGVENPFLAAAQDGQQSVLEIHRLSVPTPSILPSYNQIGFDSLHYIAGAVDRNAAGQEVLWVIEGRLDENNQPAIDPEAITRYPLVLDYDDGLVTLRNYDGYKTKFIGSWDMPFASYRLSTALDENGELRDSSSVIAVANCDEIEFYGIGLKLMGMSEFKTGQMFVRGGAAIRSWENAAAPKDAGAVAVEKSAAGVVAEITGGSLKADEHVFSIMLAAADGSPLPLYYTKNTTVTSDGSRITISLTFDKDEIIPEDVKIYVLVDTWPVYVK